MDLSTYTGLKAAAATFLIRDDMTAEIPVFISLAEGEIFRLLRTRKMMDVAALALVADTETVALPSRFLDSIDVRLTVSTGYKRMSYLSPTSFEDRKALGGFCTGADPEVYTIIGDLMYFLPVPASAYVGRMTFWRSPEALSDPAVPSNWILAAYPALYLYGTLMQAPAFLVDEGRVAGWTQKFGSLIAIANATDQPPSDESQLRADDLPLMSARPGSYRG